MILPYKKSGIAEKMIKNILHITHIHYTHAYTCYYNTNIYNCDCENMIIKNDLKKKSQVCFSYFLLSMVTISFLVTMNDG